MPAPGHYVTIKQVDPTGGPQVRVLMDEQPAAPEADGGWQVVNRPRRKGGTEWVGQQPYFLPLDVVLDGLHTGTSQEPAHDIIRRWMRVPVGLRKEPAVLRVEGACRHLGLRYVLNSLVYREQEYKEDGQAVRLRLSLGLLEYVPLDTLVVSTPSGAPASPAAVAVATAPPTTAVTAPTSRTYEVRAGDTLSAIAARELGSAARWPEIAALNGLRDPNRISVGQTLRLP